MRARIAPALALSIVALSSTALSGHRRSHAPRFNFPAGHRVVILFARYTSSVAARNEAYRLEPRLTACVRAARALYAPLLDELVAITATVHLLHNGRASHVELFPSRLPASLSACLADPLLDWQQTGHAYQHRPEIRMGLGLAP